ncbi:sodium:solute symporter family transporter [Edaphobacillus lindanitolerans]|uniref:Na+/proline symporter n=1 Tax=Edaphobacillus lindanitolerans TaxID=550447 RepID=A0A1U7PI90_9BACI|nr:Na(+)/glucose symporter [Edaphobacillus lindanitolerans]SIT72339.1 Na+/proline symporter [Edaphobacillus lindanitolerans]
MTGALAGYSILFVFAVILIGISALINKNNRLNQVDELLTAGRGIPFGFIAASVFVAWVWAGSLMGAGEAGIWYGVSGGFNYAWGAALPFLLFIPIALRIRTLMPKSTTFIEFIRERFGTRLANTFLVFGICLVLYVCVMQAVGIAYAFEYTFGLNFKITAFLASMLFASFIAIAGLRGSIYNSVFQFFVILLVVFITVPFIVKELGLAHIFESLKIISTDTAHPEHNPDALIFFNTAGLRYGLSAVVIAMGQVLLSQSYYSTAASAKSTKSLFWAYLIGTVVAWMPIPIIFGNVIGGGFYSLGLTSEEVAVNSGAAPYIFQLVLGDFGAVAFVILILMTGLTTGGNGLAGLQAMFTLDLYKRYIRKNATESQQTRFGRMIILLAGVVIGAAATLLDGVSLLMIDIFSGILFAAPAASLILGLWLKRLNSKVAFASIAIGLISGLSAFVMIQDEDLNWFVGNMLSLFLPFVVILVSLPFTKHRFDYNVLRTYEPDHHLSGGGERV